MTLAMQDCLWDILESEASERYFINDAEKPAFLLLDKWNPLSHGGYELYMNHVCLLCRVKSKKQALAKLDKMLETARIPLTVWKETKRGGKTKRVLYATLEKLKEKGMTDKTEPNRLGSEVQKSQLCPLKVVKRL